MSEPIQELLDADVEGKTVEQWLNEVDYNYTKKYVPSKFALEFITFIKLVNGGDGEENETPILHYVMLDQFADPNESSIANMVHRGAAKTTLFGEYLFLYIAVYGKIPGFKKLNLAIYVSDSIDNGVKNMRQNLEYRWENSDFLKKYVPKTKFTVDRWEFTNLAGNKLVVKGYGAKTGVRGVKEMGKRPQLAVLDDLVSDEDARSATVIASIEDTVYKAIEHAMHPKKNKIVWSGTPFNANDPLYKAVESGAWRVNVFPVCERFPCSREEFKGSWEDRFSYDYVMSKYIKAKKTGKLAAFYQELMLRITSEDERLVFEEDLPEFSRRDLMRNKHQYNFYITTDFATSEKEHNDLSTLAVWAVNYKKQKFLVDGYAEKQQMDRNIESMFNYVRKYNPMSVGVETSGQQKGYIPWIREKMVEKNVFFTLAKTKGTREAGIRAANDKSKFERFLLVLPDITNNQFHMASELKETKFGIEVLDELSLATTSGFRSKYDDCIDLFTMTHVMDMWEPSEPDDIGMDDSGLWSDGEGRSNQAMDNYLV